MVEQYLTHPVPQTVISTSRGPLLTNRGKIRSYLQLPKGICCPSICHYLYLSQGIELVMKIHVNVMELLVEQEIVKYLKTPEYKHLRGDIVSLMTYALNRVPPLYASSVQGLKSQINRAKQDYRSHIENAVRWSFTAVNKAPRQQSPELTREVYQRVLAETRRAVRHHELSPIDLPEMIDDMMAPQQPAADDSGALDSGESGRDEAVTLEEMLDTAVGDTAVGDNAVGDTQASNAGTDSTETGNTGAAITEPDLTEADVTQPDPSQSDVAASDPTALELSA